MNETEKKAEALLLAIITNQPGLLKPPATNSANGRDTGDFISALRSRLIEMYSNTQN